LAGAFELAFECLFRFGASLLSDSSLPRSSSSSSSDSTFAFFFSRRLIGVLDFDFDFFFGFSSSESSNSETALSSREESLRSLRSLLSLSSSSGVSSFFWRFRGGAFDSREARFVPFLADSILAGAGVGACFFSGSGLTSIDTEFSSSSSSCFAITSTLKINSLADVDETMAL